MVKAEGGSTAPAANANVKQERDSLDGALRFLVGSVESPAGLLVVPAPFAPQGGRFVGFLEGPSEVPWGSWRGSLGPLGDP